MERELLQTITSPFSAIWLKIGFLVFFGCLCLFVGNPLIPTPLLFTKRSSQGAVAMISMEKKLLQAITTPFSLQWPKNSIFSHFWPFFTICAYACKTP